MDILVFSEIRIVGKLCENCELCERGVVYIFFWNGWWVEERWEVGVGFVIKIIFVGKLVGVFKGVNDCLMMMRFFIIWGKFVIIFSEYVFIYFNLDGIKKSFMRIFIMLLMLFLMLISLFFLWF